MGEAINWEIGIDIYTVLYTGLAKTFIWGFPLDVMQKSNPIYKTDNL